MLTTATDILKALHELYPEDKHFKASFAEKELRTTNSRTKKVARFILFELEKQMSGKEFNFESAKYNLEHILPEHPSEEWSYIEESIQERLIYRLGNLTPLESKPNKRLGNGSYGTKQLVYRKSVFSITRAIAENYDEWNENKIVARQQRLADVASALWKIDFP